MTEKNDKDKSIQLAELTARAANKLAGSPVPDEVITIASKYGQVFWEYWVENNPGEVKIAIAELERARGSKFPPFMVIGLGRCGAHITGTLAEIVASAQRSLNPQDIERNDAENLKKNSFALNRLFSKKPAISAANILAVEPVMIVGDVDETTFDDISRSVQNSDQNMSERLIRVDYRPLAWGGVGNVPIVAEFLTRGLLLLPPVNEKENKSENLPRKDEQMRSLQLTSWAKARTFLLDAHNEIGDILRLVFYVFSASGGTGSGSASEFLKAQRYALARSTAAPQIYVSGVAVFPSRVDLQSNQTHQRNCGRLLVQYLADMNILLSGVRAFREAPRYEYNFSYSTEFDQERRTLNPWNGLCIVSNDLMDPENSAGKLGGFERAEDAANYYIAQQMFNISSAQLPVAQLIVEVVDVEGKKNPLTDLNAKSLRLDTNDLRTGLIGPYAACFAAVHPNEASNKMWLERMFISAIALPHLSQSMTTDKTNERPIVEGISISPEKADVYRKRISKFAESLNDASELEQNIFYESLKELHTIGLYQRCPRAVIVFTAPQDSLIPENLTKHLHSMISALLPNLSQARIAVIRGTTSLFTLSLFLEGSVMRCPDIIFSLKNYLWLSWADFNLTAEEFDNKFKELFRTQKILTDSDLDGWIIDREDFKRTSGDFDNQCVDWERSWQRFVNEHSSHVDSDKKSYFMNNKVSDFLINRSQLLAALNYVMYVRHYKKLEVISEDDD